MNREVKAPATGSPKVLHSTGRAFLLVAWVCALAVTAARADDWPWYRGPNRDGTSAEKVTATWPLQVLWTTNVGAGYSETVVSGGRLYTWGWKNGATTVYCLNPATGAKIWSTSNPFNPNRDTHQGQCATLTVSGGKVYGMDREANLYCYDAKNGTELWHRDINKEVGFQCYQQERGESSSPVVEGNLILFCFGTGGTALDKNTGAKVWCNGTAGTSFASAYVYSAGDSRIATFITSTVATSNNTHGGVGVDVRTGRVVWEFDLGDYGQFTCADLMIAGDKVLYTSGYYGGSTSVAYTLGTGKLARAWSTRVLGNRCTCNVLYNGYVYGVDGTSRELVCMDARTGAGKWRQKGGGSKFNEHTGVIVAGGQLIVVPISAERGDRGDLILVDASPTGYKEIARQRGVFPNKGSYNVFRPSIADGRLYVRNSAGDIVCLDAKGR